MLTRLELEHVRSYDKVRWDISSPVSVLMDKNGAGKTTLLESAAILGILRSFKTSRVQDLIAQNHPEGMKLEGVFYSQNYQTLTAAISPRTKKYRVDDVPVASPAEFIAKFIPIVLSPELHGLITEGPEERRRYLDYILFAQDPAYLDIYANYKKALKQKQALLSQDMTLPEYKDLVGPWNYQLDRYGTEIRKRRQELVTQLNPLVYQHYQQVCAQAHDCRISYKTPAISITQELTTAETKEFFSKRALIGPHRDDLDIHLRNGLAKNFASQGEKTTILLALKFSELDLIFRYQPALLKILLLDDLGITLDAERREKLFEKIEHTAIQALIATADPDIGDRAKNIGGVSFQREDCSEMGFSFARWAPK